MAYYISASRTAIFTESLLKIAQIKTQPRTCLFGKINDVTMFFAIDGIREDDVPKLLAYLKSLGNNPTSYRFNDEKDVHYFTVNTQFVFKKLLPVFQDEFIRFTKQSAYLLKLKNYRLQSAGSPECIAMKMIDNISNLKNYLNHEKKFQPSRINTLLESNLSTAIDILKSSIINQVLKEDSHERVVKAWQSFAICWRTSRVKEDSKVRHLLAELKNYCEHVKPCHITNQLASPKYALAKAASQLQILAKSQLELPDEIQALITAFRADYKRGLCQYGPKGTLFYPSGLSRQAHANMENYERNVFKFFKSLSGQHSTEKKKKFVDQQLEYEMHLKNFTG